MSPDDTARRNIELKAADPAPSESLQACLGLGAVDHGPIWQRDTYFAVPHGGLKVREEDPGRPHLIQFERENGPQQRRSDYRIVNVEDATSCIAALSAALGVRQVVEKRRHLFVWRGVRIHLDDVLGLGRFIELEAVATPDSDLTREHQLVKELREVFRITDEGLRADGYATLLAVAKAESSLAAPC